jgi:two-component system LytT family response regulator
VVQTVEKQCCVGTAYFPNASVRLHHSDVNQPVALHPAMVRRPIGIRSYYGAALVGSLAVYFIVFRVVRERPIGEDILSALCNVLPLAFLVPGFQAILARSIINRSRRVQILAHPLLAVGFSLGWYWLVMLSIGIAAGSPMDFRVEHYFPTSAAAWQLLQGATVYGLVATVTAMNHRPAQSLLIMSAPPILPTEGSNASRYFVRRGDDMVPIDVDEIVSIVGADDYAEIITTGGRHLVKMTLKDFEESLDSSRFKRVHRSRIVNMDRIERAEPAGGGRILLHMQTGDLIQTSRAGAQVMRQRLL